MIVEILLKRIAGFRAVWSGLTRSQLVQLVIYRNNDILLNYLGFNL